MFASADDLAKTGLTVMLLPPGVLAVGSLMIFGGMRLARRQAELIAARHRAFLERVGNSKSSELVLSQEGCELVLRSPPWSPHPGTPHTGAVTASLELTLSTATFDTAKAVEDGFTRSEVLRRYLDTRSRAFQELHKGEIPAVNVSSSGRCLLGTLDSAIPNGRYCCATIAHETSPDTSLLVTVSTYQYEETQDPRTLHELVAGLLLALNLPGEDPAAHVSFSLAREGFDSLAEAMVARLGQLLLQEPNATSEALAAGMVDSVDEVRRTAESTNALHGISPAAVEAVAKSAIERVFSLLEELKGQLSPDALPSAVLQELRAAGLIARSIDDRHGLLWAKNLVETRRTRETRLQTLASPLGF
jgi:hypothetical protein